MSKNKYTWEQIEEALATAGVNPQKIRSILSESPVDYEGRATEGPDPEGQETYDPRAPAEKAWADMHRVQVFDPAPETSDGTDKAMEVTLAPEPETEEGEGPKTNVSFDRIRRMMSQ